MRKRNFFFVALLAAGGDSQARTPDGMDALQIALASPRESLDLIRLLRKQPGTTDTLSLAARVGDVVRRGNRRR